MTDKNDNRDSDKFIPKWLKILAVAVPIFALIVSGIWTAYKDIRDSNDRQEKDIKELTIQQSKANLEQQKERTEQEKYRLQTELTKNENTKLSIAQKEIEKIIQEEAYKSIQESSRQKELEFRKDQLESNKEIAKFRENTKQDSLRLIEKKVNDAREESNLQAKKRQDFQKKIALLNGNSSNQNYVETIHDILILQEDIEAVPSSYRFAFVDGLINRAYLTTSKAELDLIKEAFDTQLISPYLDRERLNKLLDVIRYSSSLFIKNRLYTLYKELKSNKSSKKVYYNPHSSYGIILSKDIIDDLITLSTDYLLRAKVLSLKNNTFYLDRDLFFESEDKINKYSSEDLYFNLYKLEVVSHIFLKYLNMNIDKEALKDINFINSYFPPSPKEDWLNMNKEILCSLNVNYIMISTNILEKLTNINTNCENLKLLYKYQKDKLEYYGNTHIHLGKR